MLNMSQNLVHGRENNCGTESKDKSEFEVELLHNR